MDTIIVGHGELDGLALGIGGLKGLGDGSHIVIFPARF